MALVCCYLQMHQPPRLRRYSIFETQPDYFDNDANERILRRVAAKSYLPTLNLLADLIRRFEGRFKVALSATGCAVEQFRRYCPEVIPLLRRLTDTGGVQWMGETYHHSLSGQFSDDEFGKQVQLHGDLIHELTGQRPTVFRNTELIYSNAIAEKVAGWGCFGGLLAEGVDRCLAGRAPDVVFRPAVAPQLKLLLRNYALTDDIAFRFSNRQWNQWPLTAEKFARSVTALGPTTRLCNIFMDLETFGEHQWADTGIFAFLEALPAALLNEGHGFATPGEAMAAFDAGEVYDCPQVTSWADTERDVSAWLGNAMQSSAARELYRLEPLVKASGDEAILRDWRDLTASDHLYYMCTKYFSDGVVHKYFSPYESPYDSYINFMNVLDNLRTRIEGKK